MKNFHTPGSSSASGPAKVESVRGFSLLELLVVLVIISILSTLAILAVSGLKGSRDLNKAAYDIQGVLEQARTLAMATDTYTWVGFFEESPGAPGTAGTGQVVIAVVSAGDGTRIYSVLNPPTQIILNAANLTQATSF